MTNNREPIFDVVERWDTAPSGFNESSFDFLNRIAGHYWEQPRQLMQAWLDRIDSPADYHELRQRFRARDDDQFRSAFLELYLHECLLRAGYTVTIHPDLPNSSSRHPDFFAERGDEKFYLEAIAPGTSAAAKAAAARRGVLFDVVNGLGDPNFMLYLVDLQEGPTPASAKRLQGDLRHWLRGLDPDGITDLDHAPRHTWGHNGWQATFKAIPLKVDARGARPNSRAIGVYGHTKVSMINDAPGIRDALGAKDHAYGDLGTPFVVAVGTYIHDRDRWHSTNAMYGQDAFQLGRTADGQSVARSVRQPDGYFGTPGSWRSRNVSGVLLVNQLQPYYVQRADVALWRHPDPLHPLAADLGLPGVTVRFAEGNLDERPAVVDAAQLFDLPDPWPPGDPWPDDSAAEPRVGGSQNP